MSGKLEAEALQSLVASSLQLYLFKPVSILASCHPSMCASYFGDQQLEDSHLAVEHFGSSGCRHAPAHRADVMPLDVLQDKYNLSEAIETSNV